MRRVKFATTSFPHGVSGNPVLSFARSALICFRYCAVFKVHALSRTGFPLTPCGNDGNEVFDLFAINYFSYLS